MKTIEYAVVPSPVGKVGLAWSGDTLLLSEMDVAKSRSRWDTEYEGGGTVTRLKERILKRFPDATITKGSANAKPVRILERYFAGETAALDELRTDPGGTPFQASVWKHLRLIPAGGTSTYSRMAASAGSPGAARAAGGAVGSNPIPIVIPCHRIVGADGTLTGFGGGIRRKRWLLEHEGAPVHRDPRQLRLL